MNIALLHRLRESNGAFVPWGALERDFDRASADLAEFEAFGFVVERHPYLGVAYRGPAERLCPDQIEFELGTRMVGRRVAVWNRVASTNDLAARAASSSANEGLVVLAEEQSAGRGRRGSFWIAPPRSSLLASVLLFPPPSLAESAWLTALGAVAAAEVVTEWTGRPARIKWPNDVRVGGRKIAGILVERRRGSVVGIGLNANIAPDEFPEDLRSQATSLSILRGERVDRSELARSLVRRLDAWYELGRRNGPESLDQPWRDLSEHLGKHVNIITKSGTVSGLVVDLDMRRGFVLAGENEEGIRIAYQEVLALSPAAAPALRPSFPADRNSMEPGRTD